MAGQNAPAWEVALPETGLDIMEQVDGDRVLQSGGGIVAAVLPLESSQWELMAFHPQTGAHQGTWNLTIPLGSSPSLWTLHTDGSRALIPGVCLCVSCKTKWPHGTTFSVPPSCAPSIS